MPEHNYRNLVHTPAELAAEYIAWAKVRHENEGITWGVPALDDHMIAAHPGDFCGILGRPGSGKTSLMAYLAIREAQRIKSRGRENEECVVYCTWESAAEELANFFLAGGENKYSVTDVAKGLIPMEDIERQALRLVTQPIFVIGQGISRSGGLGVRMTAEVVYSAIESMRADFNIRPSLILLDYIQIIPVKNLSERKAAMAAAPARIKELALRVGVPIFVGVQAARTVDDREEKIPRKSECQWSSSVEQACDKLIGLWRPGDTEEAGTIIELQDGSQHLVRDELLVMRKLKERNNQGRYTAVMWFEPQYLKLLALEKRNLNPPSRPDTGHWANDY